MRHIYINGCINKQNIRIWGTERSDTKYEHFFNCPKITVWCGFTCNFRLQLYVFPRHTTITSDTYCQMLLNFVVPKLKKRRKHSKTIFMQDGAAPHTANKTKEVLKKQFSDVIGLGFQSNWPSHSPDLTPCDFFLWGYLKEKVYSPSKNYKSLDELQDAVINVYESIPQEF